MVFRSGFQLACGQRANSVSGVNCEVMDDRTGETGIPSLSSAAAGAAAAAADRSSVGVFSPGPPVTPEALSCSALFNASWIRLIFSFPWGGLVLTGEAGQQGLLRFVTLPLH